MGKRQLIEILMEFILAFFKKNKKTKNSLFFYINLKSNLLIITIFSLKNK